MQNKKFLSMLGLAARARGIAFGEGAVCDGIRNGSVSLVVISKDAAVNTKKKIQNSCSFYNVDYLETEDRFVLGKAVGREIAVVLGVKVEGIAKELLRIASESQTDAQ